MASFISAAERGDQSSREFRTGGPREHCSCQRQGGKGPRPDEQPRGLRWIPRQSPGNPRFALVSELGVDGKRRTLVTPAMEAGITSTVWTLRELLEAA